MPPFSTHHRITLSRAYWSESYDQARRYGSRVWLIGLSASLILIALGTHMALSRAETLLPSVFVAFGIFGLFGNRPIKFFWLRRQMKSKLADRQIELTLDEDGMETSGPFSVGRTAWSGIEKVVRTPQGILVWPQKGIFFYMPESAIGKEGVDFVVSRVA